MNYRMREWLTNSFGQIRVEHIASLIDDTHGVVGWNAMELSDILKEILDDEPMAASDAVCNWITYQLKRRLSWWRSNRAHAKRRELLNKLFVALIKTSAPQIDDFVCGKEVYIQVSKIFSREHYVFSDLLMNALVRQTHRKEKLTMSEQQPPVEALITAKARLKRFDINPDAAITAIIHRQDGWDYANTYIELGELLTDCPVRLDRAICNYLHGKLIGIVWFPNTLPSTLKDLFLFAYTYRLPAVDKLVSECSEKLDSWLRAIGVEDNAETLSAWMLYRDRLAHHNVSTVTQPPNLATKHTDEPILVNLTGYEIRFLNSEVRSIACHGKFLGVENYPMTKSIAGYPTGVYLPNDRIRNVCYRVYPDAMGLACTRLSTGEGYPEPVINRVFILPFELAVNANRADIVTVIPGVLINDDAEAIYLTSGLLRVYKPREFVIDNHNECSGVGTTSPKVKLEVISTPGAKVDPSACADSGTVGFDQTARIPDAATPVIERTEHLNTTKLHFEESGSLRGPGSVCPSGKLDIRGNATPRGSKFTMTNDNGNVGFGSTVCVSERVVRSSKVLPSSTHRRYFYEGSDTSGAMDLSREMSPSEVILAIGRTLNPDEQLTQVCYYNSDPNGFVYRVDVHRAQ